MSITAIMLGELKFNPNVFSGRVHKVIAPEMAKETSEPKRISSGKGNYDEGQRNREAIVTFLADGNAHKLADIAHAADLSETTARRHLLDLVSKNIAMTNIGAVIISRKNPLLFWIAKKRGVGMIDIEKVKQAALASPDNWNSFVDLVTPSAILELITRLEAAEQDAARWRDLVSHQKFNNKPQVGYAINRTNDRIAAMKEMK